MRKRRKREEVEEFLRKRHSDEDREKELGSIEGLIQNQILCMRLHYLPSKNSKQF